MYLVTLSNMQGCIIVLSSTHKAWNFESVTSAVYVYGGRGLWRTLIKAQGNRGRLKRIVMLCPCVCLCTSEPVCPHGMCVCLCWHAGIHSCECPSVGVRVSGSLCICVCQVTFMHLCLHMFLAYVHTALLWVRLCTSLFLIKSWP